ncbi:DUF1311 domain-containing protein [Martelella lutilitoris]|uniref:DUF1311 domain-containing protein n=1 Tax=Martelella lutilitoris TaxID=2583532 RepID=A0A7T7HLN1_9HYPH|nr:lysozyme inhibitor LprI family protein [Martelella lutilitoris]QQM31478.1 DUF1311 domain-containing protein [Martelella lutilitoris]
MRLPTFLAFSTLLIVPVAAHADEIIYSDAATAQCLAKASSVDAGEKCIGLSTAKCINANDFGQTSAGMVRCTASETAFWDKQLNATYEKVMKQAKKLDEAVSGSSIAEALLAMERDWIKYRDARCAFVESQSQGGTMGKTLAAGCRQQTTADQALFLKYAMIAE